MRIKILFFPKYLIITSLLTFFFLPLKMSYSIHANQVEQVETIFKLKKKLSIVLDSLELEKQTRIRNDQSFEDLEKEYGKIRDSINTVKGIINRFDVNIQKSKEPVQKKNTLSSFLKSLLEPKNSFDWVILVIGSITFLSVIILLIGIVHTFLFNRAKRSKPSNAKKEKKPSLPQSFLSFSNNLNTNPDEFVETDNKNIINLKKTINNDIKDLKQFNTNSAPFPRPDLPTETMGYFDKGQTISEKIVNAANEGLSVLEISRKYHISRNKISLILHIQGIKK